LPKAKRLFLLRALCGYINLFACTYKYCSQVSPKHEMKFF
jgi:hypothetical protein